MRVHRLPGVDEMSCMPTLYFIKVALECGIAKNTKAHAECFPFDRDWIDQADFRGHVQDLLKEEGYERILGIADRVGRDAIAAGAPWIDPGMYRRYVTTTSQSERAKLLWEDDISNTFARETYLEFAR